MAASFSCGEIMADPIDLLAFSRQRASVKPRRVQTVHTPPVSQNTSALTESIPSYVGPAGFSSPLAPVKLQPRKLFPDQLTSGQDPETPSFVAWLNGAVLTKRAPRAEKKTEPVETVNGCGLTKIAPQTEEKMEQGNPTTSCSTYQPPLETAEAETEDTPMRDVLGAFENLNIDASKTVNISCISCVPPDMEIEE